MENFEAFKKHGDVIWNIANLLRGPYRPPQYRRVMIPLTVLRRLDCVLGETKDKVIAQHKKLKAEGKYDAATIEKMINRKYKLTFHKTSDFTFHKLLGDPDKLAPNLAKFISGFSTRARKIIEKFNFTDEIEKLEEANRLFEVIKQVAAVDLHPDTIPNIAMGYVFEDLVRRFNEQANEEAGDHFTPREVIKLMVNLLFTYDDLVYKEGKVIKIYDPACGTGGMLSESEKHRRSRHRPEPRRQPRTLRAGIQPRGLRDLRLRSYDQGRGRKKHRLRQHPRLGSQFPTSHRRGGCAAPCVRQVPGNHQSSLSDRCAFTY